LAIRIEGNDYPEIRFYKSGDLIIRQGDPAEEVFTLVEGGAEVLHDLVKVGEINTGEIFGALASLGGEPRTASVVALTDCTVAVLKKDNFLALIETRPQTVEKFVKDLVSMVMDLNRKIALNKNVQP